MKHIITLLLVLCLVACTSRTEHGECVGVNDDKDPTLIYKLSVWNTFLAFIFSETLIVPIVVLANEISCPVGKK